MAWVAAAATVFACGGKALDVGFDQPTSSAGSSSNLGGGAQQGIGAGASGGGPPTLSAEDLAAVQWPADVECQAEPNSPLVGTWKGHWPDPRGTNSEVVLTIAGLTEDGVPCGTVRFGEGPALPPVSDPDAIYPPQDSLPSGAAGSSAFGGGVGPPFYEPWPGYEYQMLRVESSETRLAFLISSNEILRPWCQLQPAYPGSFSCLPEWTSGTGGPSGCSISGPNLPVTSVPCFKMQYCSSYTCFCYDGSCDAAIQGWPFELHWDGSALEGTFNGGQLLFLDPVTP